MEKGTPVVVLFLITILVMVFGFLSHHVRELSDLRSTIEEQQHIIDSKTELNKRMMSSLEILYTAVYGLHPDTLIKSSKHDGSDDPVH